MTSRYRQEPSQRPPNAFGSRMCDLERRDQLVRESLAADTEPTRVIFRKFRNGDHEVIALFPDEPGTNGPATCNSYMHEGQHGSANLVMLMYSGTRPASPEEYAPLKRELESPPYEYRLAVIRRTPKNSADRRRAAPRIA